jgi:hypothetical protein
MLVHGKMLVDLAEIEPRLTQIDNLDEKVVIKGAGFECLLVALDPVGTRG